jgi:hypothetical protein
LPGIQSADQIATIKDSLPKGNKGLSSLLSASMDTISALSSVAGSVQGQFLDYVTSLPKFSIRHTVSKPSAETKNVNDSAPELAPGYATVVVSLSINCTRGHPTSKAFLPKYHRSKNLSWCILVTSTDGIEVLAFQRLDIRDKSTSVAFTLNVPSDIRNFRVRLMCDCVLDLGCNVVLNL